MGYMGPTIYADQSMKLILDKPRPKGWQSSDSSGGDSGCRALVDDVAEEVLGVAKLGLNKQLKMQTMTLQNNRSSLDPQYGRLAEQEE